MRGRQPRTGGRFGRHQGSNTAPQAKDVEEIVKKQIETFKKAYDAEVQTKLDQSHEAAYKRGRHDAEMKSMEQWLPPVDSKLVDKAKKLEFIDLSEIKAALAKSRTKDKKDKTFVIDDATGTLKLDEDAPTKDKEAIKWLEWQSLFADLMDYYLVHGGHMEKLNEILTHFRLMQRFGKEGIFTFESLQELDRHIRSRPEGQGPNFTWRFDGGPSRWLYLKEYHPTTAKEKATKTKTKKRTRSATCYDWLQGKTCKFGEKECKYAHNCSFCKVSAPKNHELSSCSNKSIYENSIKKVKHRRSD
jgi:hypothetical protein